MTHTGFGKPACWRFRARLDAYIDNELLTETNLELLEHFEHCRECTREAQERRNVQARLKKAVREVPTPAGLEARIRDRLRQPKPLQPKKLYLMAIAAALAVCFGVLRLHSQMDPLLRLAFDNHLHCAVIHHPSARNISDANRLPEPLKELTPVVQEHVPADLPLILAHECRDGGRKFIHLTFGNGRSLLSLVITRRQGGESLGGGIRKAAHDRFQLAAFQTTDYLVYTVSDLPVQRNAELLAGIAPAVREFLSRTVA